MWLSLFSWFTFLNAYAPNYSGREMGNENETVTVHVRALTTLKLYEFQMHVCVLENHPIQF